MPATLPLALSTIVILLSIYAVLKFLFFFILPYARRRDMLDSSYKGRPYATDMSDKVLLVVVIALAVALFAGGAETISLLGGLFIGATLIQLFFHAFHAPVPRDRAAPEPASPLKHMSYAIQDRPGRAWKEMAVYAIIVIAGILCHFI